MSGPNPEAKKAWEEKLVGKKYVEDEASITTQDTNTFTRSSLPKPSRVCKPGGLFTMDYISDRLNVHVDDNDVVTHVTMG